VVEEEVVAEGEGGDEIELDSPPDVVAFDSLNQRLVKELKMKADQ